MIKVWIWTEFTQVWGHLGLVWALLYWFVKQSQFCWLPYTSTQCSARRFKQKHQALNKKTQMLSSSPQLQQKAELTEEALQADHAGHKAIKVDGQLAAGIAGDNDVLHLIVESET